MRLDKLVSEATPCSRLQAKKIISSGRVSINGLITKKIGTKVSDTDRVESLGKELSKLSTRYILVNKPLGFVCSTQDEQYPSALNLLAGVNLANLHFAGRLDQDTTGLVLISDDGKWTHRITSPNSKFNKTYRVELASPLTDEAINLLQTGVKLKNDDKPTKPATVHQIDKINIEISLTEGRYHQVKRMIAAVGNHVVSLHRITIGHVTIDDEMNSAAWRYLTPAEIEGF